MFWVLVSILALPTVWGLYRLIGAAIIEWRQR